MRNSKVCFENLIQKSFFLVGGFSCRRIIVWKLTADCRNPVQSGSQQGCHLAFFETVCQKWNGLAIFWPFWKLRKIVPFNACFGKIWAKLTIFYKILKFFSLVLANFFEYLAFFHFWGFGLFLRLLTAKFGLLNIFGPGNPGSRLLLSTTPF